MTRIMSVLVTVPCETCDSRGFHRIESKDITIARNPCSDCGGNGWRVKHISLADLKAALGAEKP